MADGEGTRLSDAARAGWLYFVAGRTQEEIAQSLNVSRPTAQRLVSLCRAEGLITFRMDHPIAACMEFAARLTDTFGLVHCDIVPSDGRPETAALGVAEAAGVYMERLLRSRSAMILAIGTGRSMRASVERVAPMSCPMHRLVSLVANVARDGAASPFNALVRLAEITGAKQYPIPLPLHLSTAEERRQLQTIDAIRRIYALAERADVWITGLGQLDEKAPLLIDGFISQEETLELVQRGAVGEFAGWAFDGDGHVIEGGPNARVTSVPLAVGHARPRLCVAYGPQKVRALKAALKGRIINGLVTDEATARALLQK
jgi:DNA-binding transcriptional regulator LsrR (DeoR family)